MVRGLQKQCSRCLTRKYTTSQIQIQKYTNTVLVKVAYRHDMCYILEKVMVSGPQRQCSQMSDLQIHKYKNTALVKYVLKYTSTSTQIQLRSKLQICLICYISQKVKRPRLTSFRMENAESALFTLSSFFIVFVSLLVRFSD